MKYYILDCAMDLGINTLDTASSYGDSEEIIGRRLVSISSKKLPVS